MPQSFCVTQFIVYIHIQVIHVYMFNICCSISFKTNLFLYLKKYSCHISTNHQLHSNPNQYKSSIADNSLFLGHGCATKCHHKLAVVEGLAPSAAVLIRGVGYVYLGLGLGLMEDIAFDGVGIKAFKTTCTDTDSKSTFCITTYSIISEAMHSFQGSTLAPARWPDACF